ncbi:DUF4394 domain-containing protein [Anditalea andensis]|uniref:DUF4394 domain-containing protein n=1 Tax=Anditalea andensis TaxID=1048983 RepID=A0A074KU44_9BACT|nr:DUF4394 domain-containing protein [Anditalea andensis]KEO72439.1 hypothetical protein EL17_17000 [Anditalea andensis]
MKNKNNFKLPGIILSLYLLLGASCDNAGNEIPPSEMPGFAPEVMFTGLTNDSRIATFDARNLNHPKDVRTLTGLVDGDKIISIDYRPATGQLYGLGETSRIYIINEQTGAATALGVSSFSPALQGENASLDFNPTVDRIRVVTASGQNLRLHPELGTVVATDGNISGGDLPMIGAVAYTNSVSGASETQLYDIDFSKNKLFIQTPPNEGGLQEVGDLGVNFEGSGNFDINPDNAVSLAVTYHDKQSKLYMIDLNTGKASFVNRFDLPIIGLAFKTNPVAYATDAQNKLYRFNPDAPNMNAVDLQGLEAGETIVGLDFRPANGALYAISDKSRLLTVNTANGMVTAIGSGLFPMLTGSTFGFDFNPTVDRIRLVSNQGQNLRLHPDLGTVVFVDGILNPHQPVVNAAAYTNNFPGAETTTLYVLDSDNYKLFKQDPPNDGVLVAIGNTNIAFDCNNGFDIGGHSNMGYALLQTNGKTAVYTINLETGAATKGKEFNINPTALAVGLGF